MRRAAVFLLLLAGCDGGSVAATCDIGSESCPCTSGGSCNGALKCFSHTCVNFDGTAGAGGTSGAAGTTSAAGSSGSAGETAGAGATGAAGVGSAETPLFVQWTFKSCAQTYSPVTIVDMTNGTALAASPSSVPSGFCAVQCQGDRSCASSGGQLSQAGWCASGSFTSGKCTCTASPTKGSAAVGFTCIYGHTICWAAPGMESGCNPCMDVADAGAFQCPTP